MLSIFPCGRAKRAAGRVRSGHHRFDVQDLRILGSKILNLVSNLVGGAVNLSLAATGIYF